MRCIDLALDHVPLWLRPLAIDHVVHAEERGRDLVATILTLLVLSDALAGVPL